MYSVANELFKNPEFRKQCHVVAIRWQTFSTQQPTNLWTMLPAKASRGNHKKLGMKLKMINADFFLFFYSVVGQATYKKYCPPSDTDGKNNIWDYFVLL